MHFGKILYRHILKTTADSSMTFSAFTWNMISGIMKYLEKIADMKDDINDWNLRI